MLVTTYHYLYTHLYIIGSGNIPTNEIYVEK